MLRQAGVILRIKKLTTSMSNIHQASPEKGFQFIVNNIKTDFSLFQHFLFSLEILTLKNLTTKYLPIKKANYTITKDVTHT